MNALYLLTAFAVAGLALSVLLMPLRLGWARTGRAAPAGSFWWVLSVAAVALWGFTVTTGLRAHAQATTAEALGALKVVTGAELMAEPDAWLNVPVVVHDKAFCAEPMGDPDAEGALATRVRSRGEDEFEGEENDYLDTVEYGVEQDVVKFTLGDPYGKLRGDDEGYTVLPAGPATTKQIDTGEFSAVKGGNLMDFEERRNIPCGAEVWVSGVVTREGGFVVLDVLPRALSILTDRPWSDVVRTARGRAGTAARGFWIWLFLAAALGLVQAAGALLARGRAHA